MEPEDIEDISERFLWMWQENRDSDSVKKIRIKDVPGMEEVYVIAMIEHQSKVDYDMSDTALFCPDLDGLRPGAGGEEERCDKAERFPLSTYSPGSLL